MKIYISGKISGLEPIEYRAKFANAEHYLRNMGYSPLNPAAVNARLPDDTTYEQYMAMSLLMLSFCDGIYLLDNWQDSPGSLREKAEAEKNGLKIMYQEETDGNTTDI